MYILYHRFWLYYIFYYLFLKIIYDVDYFQKDYTILKCLMGFI